MISEKKKLHFDTLGAIINLVDTPGVKTNKQEITMKNTNRAASDVEALYQVIQQINPLYRQLGQAVVENLQAFDLTLTQRAILEGLTMFGTVNADQLAETYGISDSCLEKATPAMFERNLIRQTAQQPKTFALEEGGRSLFERIRERENRNLQPVTAQVNRDAINQALDVLQKLNQAFAPAA